MTKRLKELEHDILVEFSMGDEWMFGQVGAIRASAITRIQPSNFRTRITIRHSVKNSEDVLILEKMEDFVTRIYEDSKAGAAISPSPPFPVLNERFNDRVRKFNKLPDDWGKPKSDADLL